jgi:hypothetical protein
MHGHRLHPRRKQLLGLLNSVDAPADVTREAIVAAINEAGYTEITAPAEPDATAVS